MADPISTYNMIINRMKTNNQNPIEMTDDRKTQILQSCIIAVILSNELDSSQ